MGEKNFEEISLRELIGIVLKYKVLILGLAISALIFSSVYAFLIAEPRYKAKAQVGILATGTGVSAFDKENEPKVTTDTYIDWFKDAQFLDKVSKSLQAENITIDKNNLKSVISAAKGKDGKTISITTAFRKKEEVASIANIVTNVLSKEASLYIRYQIQQQMLITSEQIELEKSSYEQALTKYKEYVSTPDSLSRLQSEIDINESLIIQLKANLMSGIIGQGKSRQQLEQDINLTEEKLHALQDKLIDATYLDRSLKRALSSSLGNYESLSEENDKLGLAESYYNNNSNVEILLQAVEPDSSSSPNHKMIIIISIIASICFGILAAIALEYFKYRK